MRNINRNSTNNHILLVMLYVTALISACYEQPLFIRLLFLFLMVAITFTDDFVFSIPLIIILNDGLGTAIGEEVSFYWISALLVFVRAFFDKERSFCIKSSIFIAFGLLLFIFSYIVQFKIEIRIPLLIFVFFFLTTYIIEQIEREKVSLKSVFLAFGFAVAIAAFQMAFFGGVDYTSFSYQLGVDEWAKASRYGLVGTGGGDPNFSGFSLLFGLVCLWSSNIKKIIKVVLSILFLYCIVKTVSITTFIIMLLLLLFGTFIQQGINKKLKILLGIIGGAILVYFLIIVFPIGGISEQISLYYYRFQSKLNFFFTGNINELTTSRSGAAAANVKYAFDRNIIKMLFGFDSIPPTGTSLSHNTYVDVIVRFGIIGILIYIVTIVRGVICTFKDNNSDRKLILSLKFLFIAFSFTLSIYSGPYVALLSWILLFL